MVSVSLDAWRRHFPTKGNYWFPAFNSSAGLKALSSIQDQVNAGINPQKEHRWGEEFMDREFAVMIEGSWMPREFVPLQDFENRIGFLPMFPVPSEEGPKDALDNAAAISAVRFRVRYNCRYRLCN